MGTERERPAAGVVLFLVVTLAALGLRLAYLREAAGAPLFELLHGDGAAYVAWADRIRTEGPLAEGAFYQSPLYPYVLAGWRALAGEGLFELRLMQAALGALAAGLLALAARRTFGARAGWWSGLLLAASPGAVFLGGAVQKSALALFLATLALWLFLRARDGGWWRAPLAGLALGAFALTREEGLLLAPVMALLLRGRAWTYALGCALSLAPSLVHNARHGGGLAPTTVQAGPNLFIGNQRGASGSYAPLVAGRGDARYEEADARRIAEADVGRVLLPREVSRYWLRRAWSEVRAAPDEWRALAGRKLVLAVNRFEIADTDDPYALAERSLVLRWLLRLFHHGVLWPLAAAGIVLTWGRPGAGAWRAVLATQLLALVLAYVTGRYRLPLTPLVAAFAGAGLAALPEAWRARRVATLCLALAAAGAVALPANRPVRDRGDQRALAHANACTVLSAAGRHDAAIAEGRAAVSLRPAGPDGWANLGAALARAGRAPEATRAFESGAALRPDDARLWAALGTARGEGGDWEGAATALLEAGRLDPAERQSAANGALALRRLRRWDALVEHLERHLRADPLDRDARLLLAWTLAAAPEPRVHDGARAVALAARCVAVEEDARGQDVLAAAHARAGAFALAVRAARRALELSVGARTIGVEQRLRLYEAGAPFTEE